MTFVPIAPHEQKTTRSTPEMREMAAARRTIGEDPVPAPGHQTAHLPANYREINGWGADLDPKDRPSYPRELPSTVMTARGDVKHWQEPRSKIHVSNEHPGITPVFGDTCPPHGLSGKLRDYAYQFGEASNRHWLTLMFADRIDNYEAAIADAVTGQYGRNKGLSAYAKYGDGEESSPNTKYIVAATAAIGAIVVGLAINNAKTRDR